MTEAIEIDSTKASLVFEANGKHERRARPFNFELFCKEGNRLRYLQQLLSPFHRRPFVPAIPLLFFALLSIGMTCEYLEKGRYWIREFVSEAFATLLVLLCFTVTSALVFLSALALARFHQTSSRAKLHPYTLAILLSIQCLVVNEISIGVFFVKAFVPFTLMGLLLYASVFLIGCIIFSNPKPYLCICTFAFTFYGIMQHYITEFRGVPIRFSDLHNIASALEMTGEYKFTFSFVVIFAISQLVVICWLVSRVTLQEVTRQQRTAAAVTLLVCCTLFVYTAHVIHRRGSETGLIAGMVFEVKPWCLGSLLFFYYDAVYNRLHVPDGYSVERALNIINERQAAAKKDAKARRVSGTRKRKQRPTSIICIMDESFADFGHIAPFVTSIDYMPYFHSLKENVIKGHVTVSAYGGYSANSEYEFLTGGSMYFLPVGTVPFTFYLKRPHESLASTLKQYGYKTVSLAACHMNIWNIKNVYQYLDFDTRYFKNNISLPFEETINLQPSDRSIFKKIVQLYEKRDKGHGLFIWTTTMQNHGPYNTDLDEGVRLNEYDDISAERYLNVIHRSDAAIGELIEYFKKQSDPVVVLLFGDHFPHINTFSTHLYGRSPDSVGLAARMKMQQTPFFIWSNKHMPSEEIEDISLNYLSSKLMEAAGLPKSAMQMELDKIRKQIPIISSFGYKGADGNWYTPRQHSNYTDLLNEYYTMQYYRMFDE